MSDDGLDPSPSRRESTWVWAGYAVLLALVVPWYIPDSADRLILGIPLWAAVCLSVSAAIAVYTVWVIRRFWATDGD